MLNPVDVEDATAILAEVAKTGDLEIKPSVHLYSQSEIMTQQQTWGEDALFSDWDFSVAPYWVATDDAVTYIQAVYDAGDVISLMGWNTRQPS